MSSHFFRCLKTGILTTLRRGVVSAAEAASAVIAAVEAAVYISAHFADVPSLVREEHVYLKQI